MAGLQLSAVHGLLSLQVMRLVAEQAPAVHVSPDVHGLPSSQGRLAATKTQPLAGSQTSTVHGLLSLQVWAVPALQVPALQVSFWVQALPSLQAAVDSTKAQPVVGSQLSVVHGLPSLQTSGWPPLQLLFLQTSPKVQVLPSSQGWLLGVLAQPAPGSQFSVVQGLLSSHSGGTPGKHNPPLQVSPVVQALASSQGKLLDVYLQPLAGAQLSVVHGLASSQVTAEPGAHRPAAQVSPWVQTSPSSQAPAAGVV